MSSPVRRGAIRSEEAYARGKMLDHSAWQEGEKRLPRNITPSDIDMTFDNNGWMLHCEVSSQATTWMEVSAGQRRCYANSIKGSLNCALLCKHDVPPGQSINTRNDIDTYQVMIHDSEDGFLLTDSLSNWEESVLSWHNSPQIVRATWLKMARSDYQWPPSGDAPPVLGYLQNEIDALRKQLDRLGRIPDWAPLCASCGELLNGEAYSVSGKYYHRQCRARLAA